MCYGLIYSNKLLGVVAFTCPCSENVRRSVFGEEYKDSVMELHRLFVIDGTPKNTESYFVSRSIKLLRERKPELGGIISFADQTEGHIGYIYQALNFIYCGTSSKATFYRDKEGRLRHPRQSGINISLIEAKKKGWTAEKRDAKHRYVLPLNKTWRKRLKLNKQEYPKLKDTVNAN